MIVREDILSLSRSKKMKWKLLYVTLIIVTLIIVYIQHNKRPRAYSDANEFCVEPDVEQQLFIEMICEGDAVAAYKLGRHLEFAAKGGLVYASMCNVISAVKGNSTACHNLMAEKRYFIRLLLTTEVLDSGFIASNQLQSQFFNSYWKLLRGVAMEDDAMISEMRKQLDGLGVCEELMDVEKIRALLKYMGLCD